MSTPANHHMPMQREDVIELKIKTTLAGPLAANFDKACAKRPDKAPAEIVADLLETIFREDMVDAILDDQETAR